MQEINCLGDMCPVPLMKLMQCRDLKPGESVKLITDHSCSAENVREYCQKHDLLFAAEEPIPGVWEIIITREG